MGMWDEEGEGKKAKLTFATCQKSMASFSSLSCCAVSCRIVICSHCVSWTSWSWWSWPYMYRQAEVDDLNQHHPYTSVTREMSCRQVWNIMVDQFHLIVRNQTSSDYYYFPGMLPVIYLPEKIPKTTWVTGYRSTEYIVSGWARPLHPRFDSSLSGLVRFKFRMFLHSSFPHC